MGWRRGVVSWGEYIAGREGIMCGRGERVRVRAVHLRREWSYWTQLDAVVVIMFTREHEWL